MNLAQFRRMREKTSGLEAFLESRRKALVPSLSLKEFLSKRVASIRLDSVESLTLDEASVAGQTFWIVAHFDGENIGTHVFLADQPLGQKISVEIARFAPFRTKVFVWERVVAEAWEGKHVSFVFYAFPPKWRPKEPS